jgi:hypothetical protein
MEQSHPISIQYILQQVTFKVISLADCNVPYENGKLNASKSAPKLMEKTPAVYDYINI